MSEVADNVSQGSRHSREGGNPASFERTPLGPKPARGRRLCENCHSIWERSIGPLAAAAIIITLPVLPLAIQIQKKN
jgi:hypothetical protein